MLLRGVLFLKGLTIFMKVLLIGEQKQELTKFKGLLELAFPQSDVLDCHLESMTIDVFMTKTNKWDIVIFLPLPLASNLEELIQMCGKQFIPVMCIVNKEWELNYISLLKNGVKALIGYNAPLDILRNGIRFIQEGGMYFDPQISKDIDLISILNDQQKEEFPELTKRQWEVFRLVAKGFTNLEIAQVLSVQPTMIINHQKKIIEKTNSKTLPGAIAKGFYHGWLKNI